MADLKKGKETEMFDPLRMNRRANSRAEKKMPKIKTERVGDVEGHSKATVTICNPGEQMSPALSIPLNATDNQEHQHWSHFLSFFSQFESRNLRQFRIFKESKLE